MLSFRLFGKPLSESVLTGPILFVKSGTKHNNLYLRKCVSKCRLQSLCAKLINDDVIKWKLYSRYWPFMRGINWSPGDSPHKGQWREALMLFGLCLNKRLRKQTKRRWLETPSRSLQCLSNVTVSNAHSAITGGRPKWLTKYQMPMFHIKLNSIWLFYATWEWI